MTILFQRPEFAKTSVKSANHVSQPRDVTLAKVREYLLGLRSAKSDQLSTDSGEGTPSSKGSSGEVPTRRSGQRGRSSEVTKRRTRSLSRDKSGDGNNTKCSSGFGQHTLERARQRQRRRRNSEQDTSMSVWNGWTVFSINKHAHTLHTITITPSYYHSSVTQIQGEIPKWKNPNVLLLWTTSAHGNAGSCTRTTGN